jgi:hypothetical protein
MAFASSHDCGVYAVTSAAPFILPLAIIAGACGKIPLQDDPGQISGSMHWFENEATSYVFLELSEKLSRLIDPAFSLYITEQNESGGTDERSFTPINFNDGVHLHQVKQCSPNKTCASFSFRSSKPLVLGRIRFQYDASSPIDLQTIITPSNHSTGDAAQNFSALFYGLFDQSNERLAIEMVNNFGSPQDLETERYGMSRKFRIEDAGLQDASNDEISSAFEAANSETLFPASFCTNTAGSGPDILSTRRHWLADEFPAEQKSRGACFRTIFLDKDNNDLHTATGTGYARRNPEIEFADLKLKTPLKQTNEIYIALRVCDGETYTASMVDDKFYNYQQYILGMAIRPIDVCFRVGSESEFEAELSRHLADRLDQAKSNNLESRDFTFVIMLHENFSLEFRKIQSIVASQLTTIVNAEREAVSPRLVGAMVYAGGTDFVPTALQSRFVLWCPQEINENNLVNAPALFNQNCTTLRSFEIDLRVINFVTPLGPFPSLKQYNKYLKDFGDAGLARSPDLKFFSVPTGENTLQVNDEQLTFFDSERYTIPAGQFARYCIERNAYDPTLFRIRTPDMTSENQSLTVFELNNIWLSDSNPATEYSVGLTWTYPFVGRVDYNSALTGKALVGMVPFSRSFKTYQDLADTRWLENEFDFGSAVQHCSSYCDNPFFDEGGVYQISQTWRQPLLSSCPSPVIPQWNGGGPA